MSLHKCYVHKCSLPSYYVGEGERAQTCAVLCGVCACSCAAVVRERLSPRGGIYHRPKNGRTLSPARFRAICPVGTAICSPLEFSMLIQTVRKTGHATTPRKLSAKASTTRRGRTWAVCPSCTAVLAPPIRPGCGQGHCQHRGTEFELVYEARSNTR